MSYNVRFLGHVAYIDKLEELTDIDFNGEMMIRFQRTIDGEYIAVNGMNGWGYNISNEIVGNKLEILTD